MHFPIRRTATVAALLVVAGCASLPAERGYAEADQLVAARRGLAPDGASTTDTLPGSNPIIPSETLSVDQAVRLAFLYNPRIREQYARIGLGRAELEQARRISNPSFGFARLGSRSGSGSQITRSLSLSVTDVLLLAARKRFASGDLERLQKSVAAALLELASTVEVAWYESVGAAQVAAMRNVLAQAAKHSAELAQRFFDAGNINRLQLELEMAAAAQSRIDAVRASAAALRARHALAGLIGLPVEAAWRTGDKLPAPPTAGFAAETLVPLALAQRLDLAAARQEVALREDALGVTRRWRWLGAAEIGYEREGEVDGEVIRGPTVALQLPIFNQGQGAIARARAELMDARARLDGLVLSVHNDARLGVEQLAVRRDIAERYRSLLVPQREAVVAHTQEQVNFMLKGVFELILAKQQSFAAYQEYLEAVRDYWTARAELRRVAGGALPDDDRELEPTLGVEAVLPSTAPAPIDRAMPGMDSPAAPAPDQHPPMQHHPGESP